MCLLRGFWTPFCALMVVGVSMARMTDEEWRGMSDEEFKAAREKDIPEWWKRMHHVPKTLLKALFFAALAALFAKAFFDNMGGGG